MNPFIEVRGTVRASCLVVAWRGADFRIPIVGGAIHATRKNGKIGFSNLPEVQA
jgi:hypothetical protein